MKKPIDQKDIEKDVNRLMKDMNKILSFVDNLENLDIKNLDQIDKLKEQAESFDKILKTKYKDYLDDQE